MKTAEEHYQQAIIDHEIANLPQWAEPNIPLEKFIIGAMKNYAREVTMAHLEEWDKALCGEYNMSLNPDINTP